MLLYQLTWLLYSLPININGHVPFLKNMLDTVRWVKIYLIVTTSSGYLLHAAGKYFILLMYKDFHFISNLFLGYYSFSNVFVRLKS